MNTSINIPLLLEEIDNLITQGQHGATSPIFQQIFQQSPNHPQALRKLANLLFQLGQTDQAITLLADSLDIENPDIETILELSAFLRALERAEESADILYAAALRSPSHSELRHAAIEILQSLDRHTEAHEIAALATDSL